MKSTYLKPVLRSFGQVEDLTQAVGVSPTTDFVFFNGSPLAGPNDPDDGSYSYFCDPAGCEPGPTP